MRRWILIVIAFGLLLAFFFNFYHFLKARVTNSEFKLQTEKKIGQILNAKVKIGRIRFGLLKHISLSGLEIDQSKSKLPVQIGIQKIVIKYDLLDFIKQKFRVPTEVMLDRPSFDFKSLISPFSLGGAGAGSLLGMKGSVFKRIEIRSGEIQIPIPFSNEKIQFEKIKGKMTADSNNMLHLDFDAAATQLLDGNVHVSGTADPEKQTGKVQLNFENIRFVSNKKIPIENISGSLEISESEILISNLQFLLRGIPVAVSGALHHPFGGLPAWDLVLEIGEGRKKVRMTSKADLAHESVSGDLTLLGISRGFEGHLITGGHGFEFKDIEFSNHYIANGKFDIQDGFYFVQVERGLQRFEIGFSLENFEMDTNLNLNHLQVFGYDLTTSAKVNMAPMEPAWSQGDKRFSVRVATNYFIFNYHPLKDFRATFQLSQNGLDSLAADWGSTSHLKGNIVFNQEPSLDCTILVDAFTLNDLPALGVHLMPVSLEGTLEGKVHAMGPVQQPDLSGNFSIGNGKIGDFKFDHADLAFFGTPPLLNLLDSKIVRKDNTFLIKGDIDLSLKNIFQKVSVVSVDQIVIWKGLDVTSDIEKRSELQKSAAETDLSSEPTTGPGSGKKDTSKIQAEYTITDRSSLSVTAEQNKDKQRVLTVGPKIRF